MAWHVLDCADDVQEFLIRVSNELLPCWVVQNRIWNWPVMVSSCLAVGPDSVHRSLYDSMLLVCDALVTSSFLLRS